MRMDWTILYTIKFTRTILVSNDKDVGEISIASDGGDRNVRNQVFADQKSYRVLYSRW